MTPSLIDQGVTLMLYGMGTVFVFLTLLVFATTMMSKLVARIAPEKPATPEADIVNTSSTALDSATITAIEKAIKMHRQR